MRAAGLGVVIKAGSQSGYKVGDRVTGTIGALQCFQEFSQRADPILLQE